MQWGFRKSVHQNEKLVEGTAKYLNNPYMLNENADHKAHHPESEHYSDSEHVQNLHKAFKDAVVMIPIIKEELQTFIEGHCTLEEVPEVMTAMAKGERKALKIVNDFAS